MLWSDFTFAVRGLIGAPGLSAAAVVALALGIGPNTAIFSIVYATLFAPLPYSSPDQLVRVSPMVGEVQDRASAAESLEWNKRATSFQDLEAFWPGRTLNLAARDAPELVIARQVTPGGHRMLSERVWLGRDFRPDEDQPGKQHVAILTHRLWRERFGADRDIIGRDIRMDSIPYTVVGVLEPGSWDRAPANVWIPISFTPAEIANRQLRPLIVDGRLKPGVTVEQAQQEMQIIAADLADGAGRAAGYGDPELEPHDGRGNGAPAASVVAAGGSQLRRVDGVRERGQPAPLTRRDAGARDRHPCRAGGNPRASCASGAD